MAIKGGTILHVGNGFLIDRIQTGGVTGININEERLEELGNYQAVGTIRDIPDLTFEIESYDTTTELESMLLGGDGNEGAGTNFDLATSVPIDIISPYKNANLYTIVRGVIVPFLTLESVSYNFSLNDPATITVSMRGDSIFYVPGSVFRETFNGTNGAGPFNYANTALKSTISGADYYALSVMVQDAAGLWHRQRLGLHYTNTASGVTFLSGYYPPVGTANIAIVYGSLAASSYLQTVHDTTKPQPARGRNVAIRLSNGAATPAYTAWLGIQSANVDWRVTLERDEEFDNPNIVDQTFDIPEVSGSVTMKPADASALFTQIQRITGVSGTDISNATQDPPELDFELKIEDPSDGTTVKTLLVPEAKFTVPSLQGNVSAKQEADFAFASTTGTLNVYKGDPV